MLYREAGVIRDDGGAVIGAIGTIKDVTELRAAERQREEIQQQLFYSQRVEALGTLAGGIAHDLNNALVPVISLTYMVASHLPEGSRDRNSLDLVLEGGKRSRTRVRQVLAFARSG